VISPFARERGSNSRPAYLDYSAFPLLSVESLVDEPREQGARVLMDQVTTLRNASPLDDAARRLEAVLNNATVAILLMNDHQRCIYMNKAA
jgi:PAS domain-containing protein